MTLLEINTSFRLNRGHCDPNSCTCQCLLSSKPRSSTHGILTIFSMCFAKKNTFCLDSVWILDPVLFPDLFRTAVEWVIDGNLTIHLQQTQWDSSESTKMKTTPSIVQQPWITVLPCTTKAVPRRKNYDPFKYQHTIWFGLIKMYTTEMICGTNVATKWKWIAFHIIWSWKNLMINIWDLWHLIAFDWVSCNCLIFCIIASQWDSRKPPDFHPKYLKLCSEDEQSFYGFGTTWG